MTAFLPRLIAAALCLAAAGGACAQSFIGRVIAATGDVRILRGTAEIAAPVGTNVQVGDSLRLGEASNAQVRFTDESILALRPNTIFVVAEYLYDPAADRAQDSLLFRLVKGGARTVTGIIGRANNRNYRMTTPTATVGIRGTHYTVVHCDNDCRGANGQLAANGTYGSVSDGRIAVTNNAGESVFGRDQVFHVPDANSGATRLIAPPAFLADRLEGRGRAVAAAPAAPAQGTGGQAAQGTQTGSGGGAASGTPGGTSSDGRVSSIDVPLVQQTTVQPVAFLPTESLNAQGLSAAGALGNTGTILFRSTTVPAFDNLGNTGTATVTTGINFAFQKVTISVATTVGGTEYNFSTVFNSGGIPLTASGGGARFSEAYNVADFPTNGGGFRCNNCGPNTVLEQTSFSGTYAGGALTITAVGTDTDTGRSVTVSGALDPFTSTSSKAAAFAVRNAGTGTVASSSSGGFMSTDANGMLLTFSSPPGVVRGSVGTATNSIAGSAPGAGNLVWGSWTGAGANIRDSTYTPYVSGAGFVLPWITGDAPNTIPQGLGTSVNYTPVGGIATNGTGISGGTINVNFVSQAVNLVNLTATRTTGESYVMNGNSLFSPTSGRFGAGFTSATCAGGTGCTGTISGSFSGFFAGTNAEGIGLSYTVGNGTTGISGAHGFRR